MNRPYTVCHMLTSLDGKIDGAYMGAPECAPALAAYGKLREVFDCQATLYGTMTMAGSYSNGFAESWEVSGTVYPKEDYVAVLDAANYIVSIDPEGSLGWSSNTIEKKGRPAAHVIEVLTEQVSGDYLDYLRKFNISYIFAGKDRLDCKLLLEKLYQLFHIERLMIAGGGLTNWSFAQENLLDELSIVIAPVADGSTETVSIFEKSDFLPPCPPAAFRLKVPEVIGENILWLRYLSK